MFRVLSTAPKAEKTGEVTMTPEGPLRWYRVTAWPELGLARDMDDAKKKYGGRPVLEWVADHGPH